VPPKATYLISGPPCATCRCTKRRWIWQKPSTCRGTEKRNPLTPLIDMQKPLCGYNQQCRHHGRRRLTFIGTSLLSPGRTNHISGFCELPSFFHHSANTGNPKARNRPSNRNPSPKRSGFARNARSSPGNAMPRTTNIRWDIEIHLFEGS